jgi:tetratricopeptide (TPR) repeat protein
LYQRAQNYEEANKYYQQAKAVDKTFAPAYRESAELYMKFNRQNLAIENWKEYLKLNNSNDARYRFVTAMFQGKLYCDVIPEIESLQNKGFNNFYLERMLAYSNYECAAAPDGAKKGLEASDRFFKMVPKENIIYLDYKYKGLLLSKAGSDSLAIIELEKASELDKDAARELAGDIGRLYMKMKKYDKVIAAYEFKRGTLALTANEQFELGRAYYFGPKNYVQADSAFTRLIELSPTYAPGFLWKSRTSSQIDLKKELWLAKPSYEKYLELMKPEDRVANANNKSSSIEAAKYLGDYYVNSKEKDIAKARTYWNIVQELDPADKQAAAFFKANGK